MVWLSCVIFGSILLMVIVLVISNWLWPVDKLTSWEQVEKDARTKRKNR